MLKARLQHWAGYAVQMEHNVHLNPRSATNTVLEQKEDKRMSSQSAFLRIESPIPSNERLKSAIVNCISPDRGGASSLAANPFRFNVGVGRMAAGLDSHPPPGPSTIRSSAEAGRVEMQLPIECL